MKNPSRRVYRGRSPARVIVGVVAGVVLAAIILCACVFFGFKKYIVYTPDGLRLEVPWLEEPAAEQMEASP
ncbi:MAG: hypothetical protein IK136_05875 [Oscillospiraceae bacterium]|nr:hypothetical protein [Oscillospiraceae bacterium]